MYGIVQYIWRSTFYIKYYVSILPACIMYILYIYIHTYMYVQTDNAKINISWQSLREMSYLLFKMPNKNCRHTLAIFLLNPI